MDRSRATWLTSADRTAVAGAGSDPAALAAVVGAPGSHALEMRFWSIPAVERADWALTLICGGRRRMEIRAWAERNGIVPAVALDHFDARASR